MMTGPNDDRLHVFTGSFLRDEARSLGTVRGEVLLSTHVSQKLISARNLTRLSSPYESLARKTTLAQARSHKCSYTNNPNARLTQSTTVLLCRRLHC